VLDVNVEIVHDELYET